MRIRQVFRGLRSLTVIPMALAALLLSTMTAGAGTQPLVIGGKHVFWGFGVATPASANNLIYHGGTIESTPATYAVFWGPAWQNGFSFQAQGFTYTQSSAMTYVTDLLNKYGGTPYAGIQTQYCQGTTVGSDSCAGATSATYITNPAGQLKGTWIDPSPVPTVIGTTSLVTNSIDDPVAQEATKAAQHFGYDVNATYIIYTEPGHQATAYGSVYCAYHTETAHAAGTRGVRYAFMPYVPEQGAGCGQNFVNATDDSYGHGYFDGYSVVTMHEVEEAVTDPDNDNGNQDGWNDASGSENGDKCAWTGLQNVTMNGQFFALQPLWSNKANGGQGACAFS